ncbi:MAG TPA: type III pantothenate kinase [Cytophagaceae bacterium]|nr:type III pantothenate kinase [Cytophagaceae bacterium]
MNLLIDSGNTFTKAALCDEHKILQIVHTNQPEDFIEIEKKYKPAAVIISSVNKAAAEILRMFPNARTIQLNADTPVPIQNLYKTPATLGMDRLAGVIGASTLFPQKNCLCIDAGTCITYDLLDAQGRYLGGSIGPGLEMRFKALHTFTARLPLIHQQEKANLTGNTTETSILSGVQIGIVKEMEGIVAEYKTFYPDLQIIITGGDAGFFESRIKDTIFVAPDLLFLGLKRILEYNVS